MGSCPYKGMRKTENLALAIDSMVISERCMAPMFYPKAQGRDCEMDLNLEFEAEPIGSDLEAKESIICRQH